MGSIIELSSFGGENGPHMGHHTPLFSQKKYDMGIIAVPWPPLGLHLAEGRPLHTLGNTIFSIMMDL